MSLFSKRKKRPDRSSDELTVKRTEISSDGEKIEGIYGEDEPAPVNKRYKRAAVAVGISKYIVITLFFLFFMTMTFVYSSDITFENYRYILKDMNLKIPTGVEEYGQIYYVSDMEQSYAVYRDDFVCVGRGTLEVIDMTGKQVQSTPLKYVNPRLITSGKYMLVYDLSNNSYSIFNTFSLLHSETLDYPISCADCNDNGYYMIVSRDAEYKSTVGVYNKDMKRVYLYQTNERYVYDAHLYNDGSFALYTCKAQNGDNCSEIIKGNIKEEGVKVTYEKYGTAFLSAKKSGADTVSVLCSDSLLFFSADNLVAEYSFFGRVCRRFAAGDGNTALVLSSEGAGADSVLIVFDTAGEVLYETETNSDISALYCSNKNVYGVYTEYVQRFEINTSKTYNYDSGYETKGLVFASDEVILVATAGRAYPVSVYDDFKETGR
ncbi:MAG: hypothetical protein IJT49_06220 [Clostridia bacterium]|nr:hypothetical protein [Clostridia bacterium]